MLRQIVGYHQDEHGDRVADLKCDHARYLGKRLRCKKCREAHAGGERG